LTHHYHAAREAGITLEEMLALDGHTYETFAGFSQREKAAIKLAEELTLNVSTVPVSEEILGVSQQTQTRVKELFNEAEIVELTIGIASFNFMNRINRFLNPDFDVEMPPDKLMALLK